MPAYDKSAQSASSTRSIRAEDAAEWRSDFLPAGPVRIISPRTSEREGARRAPSQPPAVGADEHEQRSGRQPVNHFDETVEQCRLVRCACQTRAPPEL